MSLFNISSINNVITIAPNGVPIQPIVIFPNDLKLIFLPFFAIATPITAPTEACELEIGTSGKAGKLYEIKKSCRLREENKNKTIETDNTTIRAPTGDKL